MLSQNNVRPQSIVRNELSNISENNARSENSQHSEIKQSALGSNLQYLLSEARMLSLALAVAHCRLIECRWQAGWAWRTIE